MLCLSISAQEGRFASAENEITVVRGETIEITITLLQNGTFGDPVSGQEVEFYDQTHNTLLGTNQTDAQGVALFTWAIPSSHPLGLTVINATFRGNESLFLLPSFQTANLRIVAYTRLTPNKVEQVLAPSDSIEILVTLVDDVGNPIQDAVVMILQEHDIITSTTTNSSGVALLQLVCNTTWLSLGENTITLSYSPDQDSFLVGSQANISIGMYKIPSIIRTNDGANSTLLLGDVLSLQVSLTSSEGSLSDSELGLYTNGHLLTKATTDSQGNCTISITIDNDFMLGHNVITIEYSGTERYTQTTHTLPLTVLSPVYIHIETPETAYIGNVLLLNASVRDNLGRPIPNLLLSIHDLSSASVSTGYFEDGSNLTTISFSIEAPVGVHTIAIECMGNDYLVNGSTSMTIVVWSKPDIELLFSNVEHYASPYQNVTLETRLSDWQGNLSDSQVIVFLDGMFLVTAKTDMNGIVTLETRVPNVEGSHNISFFYQGTSSEFQMHAQYDYLVEVTRQMPTNLTVTHSEIIPPLKEVFVKMTLKALNGTLLHGVMVSFEWQSYTFDIMTMQQGQIELHLPIPVSQGFHALSYHINSTWSIAAAAGSFDLFVAESEILSSEGLGPQVILLTLMGSVALVVIPAFVRKSRFI
ncbi:MAG: hypothetical protein ACTSV3_01265 [Candidatus Thorarchaeota archaeon]|nr:MAG: hypothetical protein DRP09_07820 [Candidatus Thorarchaeota archaeon]